MLKESWSRYGPACPRPVIASPVSCSISYRSLFNIYIPLWLARAFSPFHMRFLEEFLVNSLTVKVMLPSISLEYLLPFLDG